MRAIPGIAGSLAGVVGIALCLGSGVARLAGYYILFGYEMRAIFITGVALMVMGCLGLLHDIRRRLEFDDAEPEE